jgi:hypothetical protein
MGNVEVGSAANPRTTADAASTPTGSGSDAPRQGTPGRKNTPVIALFAFVALLVGAGAVLAVGILANRGAGVPSTSVANDNPSGVANGKGPFAVGQSVRTSFGVVAVQYVYVVSNVAAPSGSTPIDVGLAISNLSGKTVTVDASQFEVVADGGKPIPITLSAPHPEFGQMLATVARTGSVRFIVPAHATKLELRFHVTGGGTPTIVVELGRLDQMRKIAVAGGF